MDQINTPDGSDFIPIGTGKGLQEFLKPINGNNAIDRSHFKRHFDNRFTAPCSENTNPIENELLCLLLAAKLDGQNQDFECMKKRRTVELDSQILQRIKPSLRDVGDNTIIDSEASVVIPAGKLLEENKSIIDLTATSEGIARSIHSSHDIMGQDSNANVTEEGEIPYEFDSEESQEGNNAHLKSSNADLTAVLGAPIAKLILDEKERVKLKAAVYQSCKTDVQRTPSPVPGPSTRYTPPPSCVDQNDQDNTTENSEVPFEEAKGLPRKMEGTNLSGLCLNKQKHFIQDERCPNSQNVSEVDFIDLTADEVNQSDSNNHKTVEVDDIIKINMHSLSTSGDVSRISDQTETKNIHATGINSVRTSSLPSSYIELPKTITQSTRTVKVMPKIASRNDFEEVNETFQMKANLSKQKSDRKRPSSQWKIWELAKYLEKEQVIARREYIGIDFESDIQQNKKLMENMKNMSKHISVLEDNGLVFEDSDSFQCYDLCMKYDGLKLWTLPYIRGMNESTIRSILQPVLKELCHHIDINVRHEETLNQRGDPLPGARADLLLSYKRMKIGVVEFKTPKAFKSAAITQFMFQLLHLQYSHRWSNVPSIGILTDGYRFIFLTLKGNKFIFEKKNDSSGVKVHHARSWPDLFKVFNIMRTIFKSATDAVDNTKVLKRTNEDESSGSVPKMTKLE